MNKTFIILVFILLIIYCLNYKKKSKNKKQLGGLYDNFFIYYITALKDKYIKKNPRTMFYLITNLPAIYHRNIIFFNTIKVLIEGNVNVNGSRFIGNNKEEKINKIYSNLKYIKYHIELVDKVYEVIRDREGLDYYEHRETKEKIYTYPLVKLENNTILKFQTGENLKDYIIALQNEYIPRANSPPKSMLKYLSLYKNINTNTLSSFNHIKLLIETSNNKEATTINIIRMIQNKKGIDLHNMVLQKLNKWSMHSQNFPGYMIEKIRTVNKPSNIKKIEKYVSLRDILDKLEKDESIAIDTTSTSTKPLKVPNVSIPDTSESLDTEESIDTDESLDTEESLDTDESPYDGSDSTSEIDFEKQYYILKDQNKELEIDFEESLEKNNSLEKNLHNTRQQLKNNRGKLDSFRIMDNFDQNRDGLVSRVEIENLITGKTQKKGGRLDKYYKLL